MDSLRFCRIFLLLLCVAAASYSQSVVMIEDLEIRAEQRGLVLIVTGDGAVNGKVTEKNKNGNRYSELSIRLESAESALNRDVFEGPEKLPVKTISVLEKNGGAEFIFKMEKPVTGPVQVRSGGNQMKLMLTKDPQPELSWKASSVKAEPVKQKETVLPKTSEKKISDKESVSSAKKSQDKSPVMNVTIPTEAEVELQNIRVIQRNRTAALYFDFSSSPIVQFSNEGESLTITFINVANSLKKKSYKIPGKTGFRSLSFRQKKNKDDRVEVTATVKLSKSAVAGDPVGTRQDDSYAVYIPSHDSDRVFLWSADKGEKASHSFARIGSEPLDMEKMEKRATHDTERPLKKTDLFPLKEEKGSEEKKAPAPSVAEKKSEEKTTKSTDPSSAPASVSAQKAAEKKTVPASVPATPKPPKEELKPPPSTVPEKKQARKPDPSITIDVPSRASDVKLEKDSSDAEGKEVVKKSPEGELVKYRIYGRDPFVPLVKDTSGSELPNVEALKLVGVLEDSRERIALLEDGSDHNRAYALRETDLVESGKVLRIYRNKVVFLIRDFDVSRSYTLSLTRKPEASKVRDR
ncbi:MAG: hypothetical protein ACOCW1_01455 [Chitinispirillaceae bacterium]